MMISSQIITEDNIPVAIVLDYSEYLRLKEIEENQLDYDEAVRIKKEDTKWTSHSDLKKELEL